MCRKENVKLKQLDLFREIIVDNFAGGGGASTGIEMATGMSVDIAINHDPAAIAMHKLNHPDTEHFCESVWDVDPKEAVRGRKVGLAWFSPDCKHFSKAKGGKPVDKNIRGLAWVAVKWAITVKPRVIMLENVEEFKTWGPIDENGNPIKWQIGVTFNSFIKALEVLGYNVEFKDLRACDYGAPTTRKRFFMIARSDGRPIVWPNPTHGDPNSEEVKNGKLKPWRTAGEIIDWSIGTPSIFDRKKPLAENTMRRIARGIERFVVNNPSPFIVRIGQTGFGGDRLQYPLNMPLTTITTKAEHLLVAPTFLVNTSGHPGSKLSDPLKTITTGGHHALITPFLTTYYTETTKNGVRGQTLQEPIATIPTANRFGLVNAFLTKYYGSDIGQQVDEPLHTITTKDRFGLITVHGKPYQNQIVDIGMRMLQPHELYAAQGFPANYLIDKYANGQKIPKAEQVKRVGNSVPPDLPEALVRANLPELCARSSRYAVGV
ncbi:DNA cytosine methyltransferase [Lysinibacillus macroides]|uniref:DNA (cytosine-5-)-methyltransferase n=1 Tax=Lysinibacillus macroides TaxID=33935 RepID=A0A0N0UWK0_9BACI|nr:DNA cytosine methyltransferase [Lysinibacillus macroides]KOY81557.1 DNA methyltransferase [Lysinibacillus macroides]QPR69603.1 DNA cytosine methyltransferase [Lysinibacillus macroides]